MGTALSLKSVQSTADPLTYEPFFGLTEKPFSLNADPRFLYHSPSHAATFENLLAGIRRREGLLVLTGEIGTGKTMLCRAVLRNLGRKTFSSFVPDPFASREDLLKMLLIDFGVMSIEELTTGPLKQASRTELSYLLAGFLESIPPLEAFVVVIIDEAQNMSLPLIEETRILADSFGSKGHLQIVFVGQPELHAKMKLPEMRQVDQRVCGYNRLAPLGRDAVAGYVEHRLHVAGLNRERVLFSPELIDILHRRSGGVPRLINRLCDRAMHHAHQRRAAGVDRETLETALIELGSATLTPTWAAIAMPETSVFMSETEVAAPPSAPDATPQVGIMSALQQQRQAAERLGLLDLAEDLHAALSRSVDEDDDFSKLVDSSVARDFASSSRKSARDQDFAPEPVGRSAPRRAELRESPAVTSRSTWSEMQGPLRSETYLQRLRRQSAKSIAVVAVCFAALIATVLGASLLPGMLASVTAAPELPALPSAPAVVVLDLAPPASPIEPTQGSQRAAAGDYLISVGLYADRSRADRLVEELTQAGLPAMQRPFQLRNQQLHQVVLGPFANRSDAVEKMHRLRQLGGYDDANVLGAP